MSSFSPRDTKQDQCSDLLAVPKQSSFDVTRCSRARNERGHICYSRYAYKIDVRAETDGRFYF